MQLTPMCGDTDAGEHAATFGKALPGEVNGVCARVAGVRDLVAKEIVGLLWFGQVAGERADVIDRLAFKVSHRGRHKYDAQKAWLVERREGLGQAGPAIA